MMEVAMSAVTAEVFKASSRRDGHGLVRQRRQALAVRQGRQVHQGDMIIPVDPAATFCGMMGGSGGVAGTVHGHICWRAMSTAVSLCRVDRRQRDS